MSIVHHIPLADLPEAWKPFDRGTLMFAMQDVSAEVIHARSLYPPFHSAHEGLAVVEEEFLELREEVFKNPKTRERQKMYTEAMQLAAMAVRFMLDIDAKGCIK